MATQLSAEELEASAREILAKAVEERRKERIQKEEAHLAKIESQKAEAREQRDRIKSEMETKLGEAGAILDRLVGVLAEAELLNREDYALRVKINDGQASRQITNFKERLGFCLRFALSDFGLDRPHPGLPWRKFEDLL